MIDPVLISNAYPGDDLVARVTGTTGVDYFHASGRKSLQDIEAVLAGVRRELRSFTSILDFGCGCGRIMLWLGGIAQTAALHGVDIDQQAVQWAQQHMPDAKIYANAHLPPLDYETGSFDLIYNHSVFTHLDEQHQDLWLAELQRVTRPGGLVLLTVHGEHAFAEYERGHKNSAGIRNKLEAEGFAFLREDGHEGGPFPDFYHTSFHAPWYVFAHWSRWFAIRAYIPRGSLDYQDFVLLERLPDTEARPTLPPLAYPKHEELAANL